MELKPEGGRGNPCRPLLNDSKMPQPRYTGQDKNKTGRFMFGKEGTEMAHLNVKLEYTITLQPDELKLVLAVLEGRREFTDAEDEQATQLAIRLRGLRQKSVQHVLGTMA